MGDGPAGPVPDGARRVDGSGCALTPGFVNVHHHLYQWATRGLAVDATLFGWLTDALPDLGRDRRGHRRGPRRSAPWAGWPGPAVRRPPTTTTSSRTRAATCSARRRRGPDDRPALPPDPRLDGPRAEPGRAAAGPRGRGHRRHPRRRPRRRSTRHHDPSPDAMVRVGAGALLAVLGDRRPAARVGRAGPRSAASGCTPTCARRWTRRRTACEQFGLRAGRLRRVGGLAGPGRLVRPRGAPVRLGHRRDWPPPAPSAAHCPTSNARLGSGIARARDLRDAGVAVGPRRRRRRVQRGRVAARGGPALAAVRPGARRPDRAHRHGQPGDGDDGRRPGDRAGRRASARSRSASRPTWPCGGWTRWRTSTSPTRSPRWCSARRRRSSCCWSRAARSSSGTGWSPSTRTRSPTPYRPPTHTLLDRAGV